ncbi:MAG: lipoprotein, partial [Desulfobulbaceae bacterium]|nr:lipoprotein [Desulfobulbaceae bacterium]
MKKTTVYFILALIILAGCSAYRTAKFNNKYGPVRTVDRTVSSYKPGEV